MLFVNAVGCLPILHVSLPMPGVPASHASAVPYKYLDNISAEMNGQSITNLLEVRSGDDRGWQHLRPARIATPEMESPADFSQTYHTETFSVRYATTCDFPPVNFFETTELLYLRAKKKQSRLGQRNSKRLAQFSEVIKRSLGFSFTLRSSCFQPRRGRGVAV